MAVTELDLSTRPEPFLRGYYAPIADERTDDALPVVGEIPAGLRGMFLRNGPNAKFEPSGPYHLFDGDGMLHAITVTDEGVSYRNRWIRSRGLAAEERAGRSLYGGMYQPTMPGPDIVGDGGPIKNTANTHTIRHAGRMLALMEAGIPTEFTPDLDTVGEWSFHNTYTGSMTAHPKVDPVTGEMLAFSYVGPLTYFRISPDGRVVQQTPIDTPAPVLMHDFAVTHDHAVFLDAPAVLDFETWFAGGPMSTWQPERGTRLGVMPREGGVVRWFEIDPSWVVHFLNAYTDGSRVIVDGCRTTELNLMLDPNAAGQAPAGTLTRFTIDLDAGSASFEALDDRPADFPRMNDDFACGRHRYGYASWWSSAIHGVDFDAVIKYDLDTGTSESYTWRAGTAVGEFSFAPDPAGTAEDDGWLVNFVTDLSTRDTEFVVLDARDVAAGPIARVPIPRRIPAGFHGNWFPTST